jgi:hypothetical protein
VEPELQCGVWQQQQNVTFQWNVHPPVNVVAENMNVMVETATTGSTFDLDGHSNESDNEDGEDNDDDPDL